MMMQKGKNPRFCGKPDRDSVTVTYQPRPTCDQAHNQINSVSKDLKARCIRVMPTMAYIITAFLPNIYPKIIQIHQTLYSHTYMYSLLHKHIDFHNLIQVPEHARFIARHGPSIEKVQPCCNLAKSKTYLRHAHVFFRSPINFTTLAANGKRA